MATQHDCPRANAWRARQAQPEDELMCVLAAACAGCPVRSRLTAACVLAWVSALSGNWLSRFPGWMLFTHSTCDVPPLKPSKLKSNFSIYLKNHNVLRWMIHINSSQSNEKSFSSRVSTCLNATYMWVLPGHLNLWRRQESAAIWEFIAQHQLPITNWVHHNTTDPTTLWPEVSNRLWNPEK